MIDDSKGVLSKLPATMVVQIQGHRDEAVCVAPLLNCWGIIITNNTNFILNCITMLYCTEQGRLSFKYFHNCTGLLQYRPPHQWIGAN